MATPAFLAVLVAALPSTALGIAQRQAYSHAQPHRSFDKFEARDGYVRRTRGTFYDRPVALRAHVAGNGNGFSRGVFRLRWREGANVWFGAAFRLRPGFYRNQQGQVDLVRWDDYPAHRRRTTRSGVVIFGSDHRARVVRNRLGVEEVPITQSFRLPTGRWFWLEVHQRLHRGSRALTDVFVDGEKVGSSRAPNTYGRPILRLRFGIVAVDAVRQRRPLWLWFDRATAGATRAGPLAARR